ncbi:MAG: hypothetical protein US70_C0014G0012 [Parcubacteria group bacterium GW2011_GWD2_38_11]|nr:MAG: hypothetical protein US70_C0014G0012 [Parcubacteria group bacterium GW2011_GWD2_38_11]
MSDIIKQSWDSFKARPDVWFFYMFLLTSALSIRKILYYLPINNSFNEYTGVYIYLSDIFLILTFLFYILYNIKYILSNLRIYFVKIKAKLKLFHVEQLQNKPNPSLNCSTWNNLKNTTYNVTYGTLLLIKKSYTLFINNYLTIFPLFIAFFSFLSILWTTNKLIATYRSIKLFEFILMYFYIIQIVPRGTFKDYFKQIPKTLTRMFHVEHHKETKKNNTISKNKCSTWNILQNLSLIIIWTGVFQSIIGVIQFIKQSSAGLFWLKESTISPIMPGVAKIILDGDVYIRAYGLFPHPNILGGFLVFSIMLILFHVEQFYITQKADLHTKANCSTWNNLLKKIINNVPRGTLFQFIILIQCLALLLTFSKSAIFGLFIGLFYIYTASKNQIVPRGTIYKRVQNMFKLFHVEQFKRKIILLCGIFILSFLIAKPDVDSLLLKSLRERMFYVNISIEAFTKKPFSGIGAGQFIPSMVNNYGLEAWLYQPVHNVFLLILNEFGFFLLFGFIYFLFKLFHMKQFKPEGDTDCSTWNNLKSNTILIYLKGILLAFVFIMFFDHYFWDIQQGQIILWILFALLASQHKQEHLTEK